MKLRVNLYVKALQPVKENISLNRLVGTVLALSGLLLAVGLILNAQTAGKKAELKLVQQQLATQQQQVTELNQKIGNRQPAPALVKQHAELSQTIEQKQKLLRFVQGEQRKVSVKYAPVFVYLAEIDPSGFWLSSFSLNASSSQFSGYVTAPELLPQWLSKLSSTAFFKGHTFSQFEIKQQDDSEALVFKVTSSAPETVAAETAVKTPAGAAAPASPAAEPKQ